MGVQITFMDKYCPDHFETVDDLMYIQVYPRILIRHKNGGKIENHTSH